MARPAPHAVREPACEIKFGQVGIAQLKLRSVDRTQIATELERKVASAPQLFSRAAVCLDFSALPQLPDPAEAAVLIDAIRSAGMLPVALSYGTAEIETLARMLDLPVLARFRAAYESGGSDVPAPPEPTRAQPAAAPADRAAESTAARPPRSETADFALRHAGTVRSGQQVYARGRDLVLQSSIGAGAEVIADGSIHVYGALRGRALAGAQGDVEARIFCLDFRAELVAIAGNYKVLEDIPAALRGKAVQVRLEGEQLLVEPLLS